MTSGGNNFIDFPKPGLHPLEGVCIKATSGGEPGGLHPLGGLHKSVLMT